MAANFRLRSLLWWRKLARKDWAIATVAFTVIVFLLTLISNSWRDEPDTNPFHPITAADMVDLTLLSNAERRGARTQSPPSSIISSDSLCTNRSSPLVSLQFAWMGVFLATIFERALDLELTSGCFTLSSFASNLNTSTYGWENCFVVVISISGLVLFMYLLGHVQTFMQATNISDSLRLKMETIIEPKIRSMLYEYGIPKDMESKVKRVVKAKLEEDEDLIVENMFSILSSDRFEVDQEAEDLAMEIKCSLFMDKLKKVDGLENKGEEFLRKICEHLEPMIYSEGCCIIREGEPLDMMFFVTQGIVLTYATNNGGSSCSPGTIQLIKKEKDSLYGEELLTLAEEPSSELSTLPIPAVTVKSHKKVEVFALKAVDLQNVVSEFSGHLNTGLTEIVSGQ